MKGTKIRRRHFLKSSASVLAASLITSVNSSKALAATKHRAYTLATASTGGTYYPVGVAIATLVKVKLQASEKIGMSAIVSAGSEENLRLLRNNQAQFAILQGLYGYYGWRGTGSFEREGPQKTLRSITMLWPNVEHFIIRSEFARDRVMADLQRLKGRRLSFGLRNSGSLGSSKLLLENLGYDIDKDFLLTYLSYESSAEALKSGHIDGMSAPAGAPVEAVKTLLLTIGERATLLEFTDDEALEADGGLNLWVPFVVPSGTYPGYDRDFKTLAQPNFLAVRSDIEDEVVYKITKTIYENLPFLNNIHSATKVMNLQRALDGLPMPLHPGAIRFFKESRVAIPDRLNPT